MMVDPFDKNLVGLYRLSFKRPSDYPLTAGRHHIDYDLFSKKLIRRQLYI